MTIDRSNMSQEKVPEDYEVVVIKDNFISYCKNATTLLKNSHLTKSQQVYLTPDDSKIEFDEMSHTYFLPGEKKKFDISVTGFIKILQGKEFIPSNTVRSINLDESNTDYDAHVWTLVTWRYASVLGSIFHGLIEYFIEHIVNGCNHEECHKQEYNRVLYKEFLTTSTNLYNLSQGIIAQTINCHKDLRLTPIMPCIYSLSAYDVYCDILADQDRLQEFIETHYAFQIDNDAIKKDILRTMEAAFKQDKNLPLSVKAYRQRVDLDITYEESIDRIISFYGIGVVADDIAIHLKSFRNILIHLPLEKFCDLRPEYITFDRQRGLSGSVDLVMRDRQDPYHLVVYDWKTCKKIFNSYFRQKKQTCQLLDYSCQLHTYANLMSNLGLNLRFDLFVVNITAFDCCIYNVKSRTACDCYKFFSEFKKCLVDIQK